MRSLNMRGAFDPANPRERRSFEVIDEKLRELHSIIVEHRQEFIITWDEHFSQ